MMHELGSLACELFVSRVRLHEEIFLCELLLQGRMRLI